MLRKRTKQLKLVLLGSLGAALSGCGGCGADKDLQHLAGEIDPVLAKRAAAAGAAAELTDGIGLTGGLFAAGPILALSAPLGLANLGSIIDQADETMDVASRVAGVPRSTSASNQPTRTRYYHHNGPGIGWFVWGYALGRSSGAPSYAPPRYYAPTPNQVTSQRTYTSSSGGSGGFGRSAPIGGGSGSVSRGGFGSSGAAHASGGS
jgi:hypothetical protein